MLAVVLATKCFPRFPSVLVLQEEIRKLTWESKEGEELVEKWIGELGEELRKGWVLALVARCSSMTLLAALNHCEEACGKNSSVIVGHLL